MAFPTTLTNAEDGVTEIIAAHLNSLEAKVGIDSSAVTSSLDYLVKSSSSIEPGHKHSKLWASDGSPEAITIDATGQVGIGVASPGAKLDLRDGGFILTDANVAHGMTTLATTETFAQFTVTDATSGGLNIQAFSSSDNTPLSIYSFIGAEDPTNTLPVIRLVTGKKSGTSYQALDAAETAFQILNGTDPILTIMASGNVGINIEGPGYPLMVNGGANADYFIATRSSVGSPLTAICYDGGTDQTIWDFSNWGYAFYLRASSDNWAAAEIAMGFSRSSYNIVSVMFPNGNVIVGAPTVCGTSADNVFGMGSGTAPSTAPANMAQMWVEDINGAAGYAGLHKMTETTAVKEIIPGVVIKGTTGQTANPYEGLIEINTNDNTLKMYADGGWRTLVASW